jgi:hypothetical protein
MDKSKEIGLIGGREPFFQYCNEMVQGPCAHLQLHERPSKVGQIKNLGIISCILIRLNLELIKPLVKE